MDSLRFNRLPSSSAVLLTFYILIQRPLYALSLKCLRVSPQLVLKDPKLFALRFSRFFAGMMSSSLSFNILNMDDGTLFKSIIQNLDGVRETQSDHTASFGSQDDGYSQNSSLERTISFQSKSKELHLAGRTIDLTLLLMVRAVETVIGQAWAGNRARQRPVDRFRRLVENSLDRYTDSGIFAISAGIVM